MAAGVRWREDPKRTCPISMVRWRGVMFMYVMTPTGFGRDVDVDRIV